MTSGCATLGDALSLTVGALSLATFGTGVGGFPAMDVALDTLNIVNASGTATKIIVQTTMSPDTGNPSAPIETPTVENQPAETEPEKPRASSEYQITTTELSPEEMAVILAETTKSMEQN